MLTKTRTLLITLIAACSFATATIAPSVSEAAKPVKSKEVTCSGGAKPGDIKTTVTFVNGKIVSISSSVCGGDGKWYKVTNLESNQETNRSVVAEAISQPVTVTETAAPATVTKVARPVTITR
jgi:hypothetical protein